MDIKAQLKDTSAILVVLDTLNRSLAGSKSRDEDMSAYVQACDRIRETLGCAVAVIHHCGTNESRPRGHTSLTGATDAQIAVARDPAGNIVATVEHMKDGPEGDQIFSKLIPVDVGEDEDGDTITSCVIEPAGDTVAAPTKAKKLRSRTKAGAANARPGPSMNPARYRPPVPQSPMVNAASQNRPGAATVISARFRMANRMPSAWRSSARRRSSSRMRPSEPGMIGYGRFELLHPHKTHNPHKCAQCSPCNRQIDPHKTHTPL